MIPTVHLNGTAQEDLVEQLCNAGNELSKAIDAMRLAAPNGRDYYPQGPDALAKAVAEHKHRMERVDAVRQEVNLLAEKIADHKEVNDA
jgi:hypothetical protein